MPELTAQDTVGEAIEQLRRRRASLAVGRDYTGRLTGLVTLDDLLARLLHPQGVREANRRTSGGSSPVRSLAKINSGGREQYARR